MADFVFNIAKGKAAYYATLPAASDALVVVPLKAAGLEADATLRDRDTLAEILGANAQATMGRKTLSAATVTVDDTNDRVDVIIASQTWAAVPAGDAIGALLVCYKPASNSGDNAIIPLTKHDFAMTPNGGDIIATVPAAGICRIS